MDIPFGKFLTEVGLCGGAQIQQIKKKKTKGKVEQSREWSSALSYTLV